MTLHVALLNLFTPPLTQEGTPSENESTKSKPSSISSKITVPFRSIRPGGGQGDRLAAIWTSAILRVDRGHLPDFSQSKSSAACASSSLQRRTDPRVVGDLVKARPQLTYK